MIAQSFKMKDIFRAGYTKEHVKALTFIYLGNNGETLLEGINGPNGEGGYLLTPIKESKRADPEARKAAILYYADFIAELLAEGKLEKMTNASGSRISYAKVWYSPWSKTP